jgi:hypothetical protein
MLGFFLVLVVGWLGGEVRTRNSRRGGRGDVGTEVLLYRIFESQLVCWYSVYYQYLWLG